MYQFKEVILKNSKVKKKILVVEFADPKYQIIGEFLMADAGILGGEIITEIDDVLRGVTEKAEINGNRCALTVTKTTTVVEDLLAGQYEGVPGLPACTIHTELLQEIITDWLATRQLFYEQEEK